MKPELERLLRESAEAVKRMTPDERAVMLRAQWKSWVVGEMMLEHPEMTKEHAEKFYADMLERIEHGG